MADAPNEYPGLTILARQAMDAAKATLPPDVGLVVFTMHYTDATGANGGLAYTSTIKREDAIGSLVEWLRHLCDTGHETVVLDAFKRWFGA